MPNTPNSFLCTNEHYDNFELELEFKVHPELNSGVQIRSNSLEEFHNGRVHGYQVEIDPSDRAYSAGIYDEGRRGWLFDLKQNTAARYAFKQDQWNQLRVVANGSWIRTWINGVQATDMSDDMTATGFIALQVHGVGGRKDPISVSWRNIRLKKIEKVTPRMKTATGSERSSQMVDQFAKVKKLADGFRFTEGPSMGPDGKIYFSDIPNNAIHVFDPNDKSTKLFRGDSGRANGLMWTPSDALIACEGGNRRVTRQLIGGEIEVLADQFEGKKLNSPNDLELDNVGGIYFTDPRYGNRDDMEMDVEGVYYLNRQRKISRVVDDLKRPNGIVLSLDYKTLYVADTQLNKTFKFDVTAPGVIENKQEFVDMGSDGMTIDGYGNLYLTRGKHLHIYSAEGRLLQKIEFPENPSNVTFGGTVRSTIFVTARTGFYAIPAYVHGGRAFANPD